VDHQRTTRLCALRAHTDVDVGVVVRDRQLHTGPRTCVLDQDGCRFIAGDLEVSITLDPTDLPPHRGHSGPDRCEEAEVCGDREQHGVRRSASIGRTRERYNSHGHLTRPAQPIALRIGV